MNERHVPYDLSAERSVLGAILLERDAILAVSDQLRSEDFYLERHGQLYAAMLACLACRVPPDLATVASELRRQERLELVGGLSFLGELATEVPTAVHVEYYAQAVIRAATLRRLIEAGGTITALGYDERGDLEATLDRAEQTLFAVSQRQRGADFVSLSTVVQQFFDMAQANVDERVVPTGLLDLDRRLNGGLRPGQLALLAARPGLGKSGLAMSIAYHLGVHERRSVGVVSLEMGRSELLQRLMAMHTGVDTRQVEARLRRGDPVLVDALGVLAAAPIAIEDSAMLTVMDVRSKARRLATVRPLDLLIVDYLQLLIGDTPTNSRVDEVSRISRQLKLLARELGCPVLALSQLSRAVEQRASKVPQLSDLRDSGSLEQDADIVIFISREDIANEATPDGVADLHVAKQRNGPLGVVGVRFDAPTTRFANLETRRG
ncbi:replicative DNA helicase [Oscillochloris sp. ZM17-4]|uniref:replicative DNA helicase n=1 Tax=Oscillochloris sp. ZM17-4 TaxID=2866714 RepID=UPI001C73DC22|nr:replicative DNA helicase [Oscillochloris sp. ZM17-4]MBX0329910.1 replicative DNA helicase [Oscillochloris sp. ZM17-4]